jgi:uncharacterized membrane protein
MTGRRLSLAKTATWRIVASLTTFLLAWLFTKRLDVSLAIGGTEAVAKTVLYYAHERAWVTFGPKDKR